MIDLNFRNLTKKAQSKKKVGFVEVDPDNKIDEHIEYENMVSGKSRDGPFLKLDKTYHDEAITIHSSGEDSPQIQRRSSTSHD